ncbi:glycosyltransferase family 4 protein [Bradyrhizobium sp. CIR3A]|uniref:glycosyltransferase family 4 protein n=1 Tax=Bradyrhizobium sp. CIR3A TaxID=2663838 RepID=UPI001605F1B9|nr:glycosyltransferase family 4 protein [Bradyrhizobium sp. CIR3A]MBB4260161.1 glycosyltransferase involved in cell wall biosynthesis [Bradyrhizobium sp. CIR3A]
MSPRNKVKLLAVATHLLPARGWGGVAVTARTFFELLAARGQADLSVVTSDACREKGHIKHNDLAFVENVCLYSASKMDKSAFSWSAMPLILQQIHRADFVYSSGIMTWPTTLAVVGACLYRRPFAFHAHGGLLEDRLRELKSKPFKWLLFKRIILPLLKKARFLNCSSEFEAANARKLFSKTILITPNYQTISSIPLIEASQTPSKALRLTFVGRLHKDKGIHRFSSIWKSFARDGDLLQVIGGHDNEYGRKVIDEFGSDTRFSFLGERNRAEVFQLIGESDALVLPSGLEGTLRENFGNVVPEALAVGRPVLISSRLAWRDLEERGVGFFLPDNDREIVTLLQTLREAAKPLANPTVCRRYAMNFDAEASGVEIDRFLDLVDQHTRDT